MNLSYVPSEGGDMHGIYESGDKFRDAIPTVHSFHKPLIVPRGSRLVVTVVYDESTWVSGWSPDPRVHCVLQ